VSTAGAPKHRPAQPAGERKVISLKRRDDQEAASVRNRQAPSQSQSNAQPTQGQQQPVRKQLTAAKIAPEAKRSITEHLAPSSKQHHHHQQQQQQVTAAVPARALGGAAGAVAGGTPPKPRDMLRLGTPSDDEVELDYDVDDLLLDEEDRLLATPSPPPQQKASSKRSATPELLVVHSSAKVL